MSILSDANTIPAVQVSTEFLSIKESGQLPSGNAPVTRSFSTGETQTLRPKLNMRATGSDIVTRAGGIAILDGLELIPPGSGYTIVIGRGHAGIDGPVEVPQDRSEAIPSGDPGGTPNYVWLLRDGTFVVKPGSLPGSTDPPVGIPACYLGNVITDDTGIVDIDFSGVLSLKGNTLFRETADAGAPTDTPPANVIFLAKTAGGYYLWTGIEYIFLAGAGSGAVFQTIHLNDHPVVIDSDGVTYRIGVDFSAHGVFGDVDYIAICRCDEAKAVIVENHAQKTTGYAEWTIFIPSDAPSGTYGGPLDLNLSVVLGGFGWSGGAGPYDGTWDAPTQVLGEESGASGQGCKIVWAAEFPVAGADWQEVEVPYDKADGTTPLTFDVHRINVRVSTPGGSPEVTVEKYTGTGPFSPTTVGSVTLGSGSSEGSQTGSFTTPTLDSGDKVRLNFNDPATATGFVVELELGNGV